MLIYLIGFMGSGKSTVSEKLSRKLGYGVADLDELIEKKAKKSIQDIFEESGEEYFRELEKDVLHETFKLTDTVIACGGGTPCFFDNLDQMKKNGKSAYLKLSAGSLFHRLAPGKARRPLIAGMPDLPLMEYIVKELEKRAFYYEQADIIIKGENLKTDELADLITGLISGTSPIDKI
jgi:shikimate kinase